MEGTITIQAFHEADGLEDWRVLGEGASAFYRTSGLDESARLVAAVAALEGIGEHPPAIDIRAHGVTFRLVSVSDDYYGMTERDVEGARRISEVAHAMGLEPDPSRLQYTLVIPGAPDISAVMPFWRAMLGYVPRQDSPDEDLVDPNDRGPGFWFEAMDEPRADGGGAIHLGIWVPHDQAQARVAAALAAGGRMVRDDFAPSWWTLADAAGNEADVATTLSRD